MILSITIFVLLIVFVLVWLKEPRIFLFFFHKAIFRARQGKAIGIDKAANFPESALLEKNWVAIKTELEKVIHDKYVLPRFHQVDEANYKISFDEGPAWKTIVLKAYDGWFTQNVTMFPATYKLLAGMPSVSTVMFSILEPRVQIPAHTGKLSGLLRYHLGLLVPATGQCFIMVNGEKYVWQQGEGILFNDTYLHSVTNETDEYRVVLFLDIKKKASRAVGFINKCILNLIILSPMFTKALKKGTIAVD